MTGPSKVTADHLRRLAYLYVRQSSLRQVVEPTIYFAAPAPGEEPAAAAGLTERETAMLRALARGLSNAAISKEFWVTEQTVKFHLTNIYRKLGVKNRTEATRYAYQHGLADELAAV